MSISSSTRPAWHLGAWVFVFATVLFPLRAELLNPPARPGIFATPDGALGSWSAVQLEERFAVLCPLDGPAVADARDAYCRAAPGSLRPLFAWSELTLDGVFPALYAALLVLLLRLTWKGPAGRWRRRLWQALAVGAPVGAALADLIENAALAWISLHHATPSAVRVFNLGHGAKWALLYLALLLLLVAVAAAGRLGRFAALVWLARVPIAGLLVLVALAALGGSDQASPTIPNMMLQDSVLQVLLVAALAGVVAASAGYALALAWEHADERTGTELPAVPRFLASLPAGSARRGVPFLVFALPLLARMVARSVRAGGRPLAATVVAALLGLAAAALLAWVAERVRQRLVSGRGAPLLARLAKRLVRWVNAAGYLDEQGAFYPGHPMATAAALLGGLAYAVGHFALTPSPRSLGAAAIPTLAYVLGLVGVVVAILGGATFLFDRWRVPLAGIVLAWMALFGLVFPVRHEFASAWSPSPLPTVGEAARARVALAAPTAQGRVLTVVTASGGGIQAAAWTARVLTGLDALAGGRFSRSIAVASSTSGGSVGVFFTLAAFDASGGIDPAKGGDAVAASESSSLEETAWGLLFPDLQRAFRPFANPLRDRAWAMERGWLRARRDRLGTQRDDETLAAWADLAASGRFPAVVFNATRIDDGEPLRVSTVRSGEERAMRAANGLVARYRYGYEDGRPGFLDFATVTAARLSATFPYVSPITQPAAAGSPPGLLRWHTGDGGYFDNNGTTGALAWLADLRGECAACLDGAARILWVQIDSFPRPQALDEPIGGGWGMSAAGPVLGLVRVRTGSQRVRRALELDLLTLDPRLRDKLVVVTLAPPAPPEGVVPRDPPLSWFLSRQDADRIENDWRAIASGPDVARLVHELAAPAP